eukprot:TRINITY_DN2101_c1_g8_i1.p1 TRINITY_DN2101_c1_g8~~TRINITY_DN2101_c1_g8_i1.p1  ORF type:complete len:349 (+),score=93.67 TRINITY_DN2101_c1_g8_i1:49-1047(+)
MARAPQVYRGASRSTLIACDTEVAQLRFLILNAPTPSNLREYIDDLKQHGVGHLVRVCMKTYEDNSVEQAGIRVHDWPFPDGAAPPKKVLAEWLELVKQVCRTPDDGLAYRSKSEIGWISEPQVSTVCPITHAPCRVVQEGEPEELPQCSACGESGASDTVYVSDPGSLAVCRRCRMSDCTVVVEVGSATVPHKSTIEESLGLTLKGVSVAGVEPGKAADCSKVYRGMKVKKVGDVDVWSKKEIDAAFAVQPPFTVTFCADYVLPCVGVHCMAGLGRAPVLVAVALVELANFDATDAISHLRQARPGCFNKEQLNWLINYRKRKKGQCCDVM